MCVSSFGRLCKGLRPLTPATRVPLLALLVRDVEPRLRGECEHAYMMLHARLCSAACSCVVCMFVFSNANELLAQVPCY